MQLSPMTLYALRLSLSQGENATTLIRRNMADRGATTSAMLLATVGLSLSMFSLKQMLGSSSQSRRLRNLH